LTLPLGSIGTVGIFFQIGELGGLPVVIIRQTDGSLKGFVNACRHRGAPVVAPGASETRPRISCPYHGWVYDLDGSLVARPYAEEAFADAPTADCSLRPIAVAEGYGLIFAQADGGEGLTADSALKGAEVELADYGLEDFVLVEARENTWDFYWKLCLDTFAESYHIRALHKNSIAPTCLSEVSSCDAFGPHPRMIGLLKSVVEEIQKPSEEDWTFLPHTTTQYLFTPSGLITYQRDHIDLWRVTPLSVDRTLVRTSLYAAEAPTTDKARGYWKKNLDLLLGVTGTEDFPLMKQIHHRRRSVLDAAARIFRRDGYSTAPGRHRRRDRHEGWLALLSFRFARGPGRGGDGDRRPAHPRAHGRTPRCASAGRQPYRADHCGDRDPPDHGHRPGRHRLGHHQADLAGCGGSARQGADRTARVWRLLARSSERGALGWRDSTGR
jgi:phenylpropionate dioxygenase-like ring-hydroxylating dioxygenase large terminal subunit